MSTYNKAAYLLIIFDLPGPANEAGELKDLLPFLKQNVKLELANNCKIRTHKQSLPNITDLIPVDTHMFVWMKTEGEEDVAKRFEIHHVGLNVHTNEYRGIQVAWAVLLDSQKKWWQVWK